MAIDRLAKITIVDRQFSTGRLISRLHELGTVEVVSVRELSGDEIGTSLKPKIPHAKGVEENLQKLNYLLGLVDQFAPEPKSFVAGLAPVPVLVDPKELHAAVQNFTLEEEFLRAQELEERYRHHERALAAMEQELAQLRPFAGVSAPLSAVCKLRRIRARLVEVPKKIDAQFLQETATVPSLTFECLADSTPPRYWLAYLQEDDAAVAGLLKQLRIAEVPLPRVEGTVGERMRKLEEDLAQTRGAQQALLEKLRALGQFRRTLVLLKAHWDNEHRKQQAHGLVMTGQWLGVLSGYIRERDLHALQSLISREFDSASLIVEVPGREEDVPVSITHSRFVRPISLLVNMYGLPRYITFDPSPYLLVNFLIFFGVCFSDVGYGLLLILSSLYLAYRAREYAQLRNFANLFLYGGISTVFFGALLGSWFGDLFLPKYLGEDNFLLKIKDTFVAFEPLGKPVIALVLALVIGMLNQFYGIALKMGISVRDGNLAGAIFDGALWLILLPGLVVAISTLFVQVPSPLMNTALALIFVGAVGLVLTQGREEKTLLGKAVVGVISLYGIFGSYGATSFIGDTLSYCRLLALGLTTGIVAMSINLIGGMLLEVPYVGVILFILVLVLGHLFNFAISVLGAFIHSARLIFVEFFGRFYDGGARPFRPLGFDSPSYQTRTKG